MTHTPTLSEDEIQAYVDGRLSASQRIEVEAYLDANPHERERIRAYQDQNAMLHGLFDHVLDEPLPEQLVNVTASKPERKRYRIAAMLAYVLIGGVSGYLLHGSDTRTVIVQAPFTERAALAHVVYTAEMLHPVEVGADQETHLVQWLSKRLGHPLHTPELNKFGYQLVGGRLLPGDSSGAAAQFMYQTSTGARLTLYVSVKDKGTAQTAFRIDEQDGQQVMYWVDDNLSFALVGEKDRGRLLDIARVAYQAMSF